MKNLIIKLLLKLLKGESVVMMAMFFAQRVILSKTNFKDVPKTLQSQVREILVESGLEYLCEDEQQ